MIKNTFIKFLITNFNDILSAITSYLHNFIHYSNLPNLFHNIGIALLTIFIPFAIAVITDILQKKNNQKENFSILDLHVVLDYVFGIKKLVLSVFFMFLPFIFWQSTNEIGKLVIILFWLTGSIILLKSLFNFYSWTKGQVFTFRLNYLRGLNDRISQEVVWRSVWEATNINYLNEKSFFLIFADKLDRLLKSNKKTSELNQVFKLLSDFSNFLNNRSLIFLVVDREVFSKLLDWHYKIWGEEKELLKKEKDREIDLWSAYSELSRVLDEIVRKIEAMVLLDKRRYSSFELFRYVKEHTEVIDNNDYLEDFFGMFYRVFFDMAMNNKEIDIDWESFPDEWLITIARVKNKEMPPFFTLNAYLRLFFDTINNGKDEINYKLDNITLNLFPEVDPVVWSRTLFFIYSAYDPNNRIKSLINRSWNVGHLGRVKAYSVSNELELEKEFIKDNKIWKDNALKLAILLFKNRLPKKDIKKYIDEAKQLKFKKESVEESKRKEILGILQAIEKFI